jgi:hypothetical protein
MNHAVHTLVLLAAIAGCSSGTTGKGACAEPTGTAASKLEMKCTGSARSCSGYGVYSKEAQRACADQPGCYPDYDSQSCKGSAEPCSSLSEVYCKDARGCTWSDEASTSTSSSGGSSTSGSAPSGQAPCAPGQPDASADPPSSEDSGAGGSGGSSGSSSGGSGSGGPGGPPPPPPAPPP